MPDESGGQQPSGDAQQGSSSVTQGIVARDSKNDSSDNGTATVNLAKDVHWINHATFWSQVGLGLIGLFALWIYNGQLTEMKKATIASAQAAYAACVSAQTAQNMFIQSESSANDSHAQAIATTQQAAAEMQSERSSVWFLPQPPEPEELIGEGFGIPFTIKNEGKGDAHNLLAKYRAVLLRKADRIRFSELKRDTPPDLRLPNIPSGYTFPEKAEPPHGQIAMMITVKDVQGNAVATASNEAHDFMNGGPTMVAVFGVLTYSDITGNHVERFCDIVGLMLANTQRSVGASDNQENCTKYNHRDAEYAYKPLEQPALSATSGVSNISCVKPKE